MDFSNVSTAELVREPYQPYQIVVGEIHVSDSGPIVLLRVWD